MPAVIHGQERDLYEAGAVQLYPLGQKLVTPSGSIFRYAEMGATVGVANKAYQGEAATAGWVAELVSTALAVGDTTIRFTDGAVAFAANLFAGGTVLVEETDDLGHLYPIKSNTASAGSAEATLTLADGVTVQVAVAVVAGNVLTVMKNPWKDIIITPITTPTAMCTGIPRVIIAANEFGWVQTHGVASCLVVDTWALGEPLVVGKSVAGALGISTAFTDAQVAIAMIVGTVADFGHCFLTLE